MYPRDHSTALPASVLIAAGVALMALGGSFYRRFRDEARLNGRRRDFGLGGRGLLAYGGVVLFVLGAACCGVGLFLPAILR